MIALRFQLMETREFFQFARRLSSLKDLSRGEDDMHTYVPDSQGAFLGVMQDRRKVSTSRSLITVESMDGRRLLCFCLRGP